MSTSSVILVGGPDTGKTNFIGRLWIALQAGGGALSASGTPDHIRYVEEVVAHLHQGHFAPRTRQDVEANQTSFRIPLRMGKPNEKKPAELIIPDISGEVWKKTVETNELASDWMLQLETAVGALLFVRVLSDLNVSPLDWVNSAQLIKHQRGNVDRDAIPTQVMLCQLLRYLELKLTTRHQRQKPRIAVMVTAWDRLDNDRSAGGPLAYLHREYPLFSGRLADQDSFDVKVFATSILGGDPELDESFRDKLLGKGCQGSGYVRFELDGTIKEKSDLTIPVAWTIGTRLEP